MKVNIFYYEKRAVRREIKLKGVKKERRRILLLFRI